MPRDPRTPFVIDEGDPGTAQPSIEDGEKQTDPKQPTPEVLRAQIATKEAELAAERRLNEELQKRDVFWAKRQAQTPSPATPRPQMADDPDPIEQLNILKLLTDEEDPTAISKQLAKAINQAVDRKLKSGEYASREEVQRQLQGLIEGALAVGKLVQEFPELQNPKSEHYKAFQASLKALQDDPQYQSVPETVLQRMAALESQNELARAGKLQPQETEAERLRRIELQRGSSGSGYQYDQTDELTPEELAMQKKFERFGVSLEDYKKERKSVQVGPRLHALGGGR